MKSNNTIRENVSQNILTQSSVKFSTCRQVFIQHEENGNDIKEHSICSCWANKIVSGDSSLNINEGKRVCAHCPKYQKRENEVLIENI